MVKALALGARYWEFESPHLETFNNQQVMQPGGARCRKYLIPSHLHIYRIYAYDR